MNIQVRGPNQMLVTWQNGHALLFSYNTPVVYTAPNGAHWITERWHSQTTQRHINKYTGKVAYTSIAQDTLDYIAQHIQGPTDMRPYGIY